MAAKTTELGYKNVVRPMATTTKNGHVHIKLTAIEQDALAWQYANNARKIWNWGLGQVLYAKECGCKRPTFIDLSRLVTLWKNNPGFEFLQVDRSMPTDVLQNLEESFKRFYAKSAGYPRFKGHHKNKAQHFTIRGKIKVTGNRITVPSLGTWRLANKGYIPKVTYTHIIYHKVITNFRCLFNTPL